MFLLQEPYSVGWFHLVHVCAWLTTICIYMQVIIALVGLILTFETTFHF